MRDWDEEMRVLQHCQWPGQGWPRGCTFAPCPPTVPSPLFPSLLLFGRLSQIPPAGPRRAVRWGPLQGDGQSQLGALGEALVFLEATGPVPRGSPGKEQQKGKERGRVLAATGSNRLMPPWPSEWRLELRKRRPGLGSSSPAHPGARPPRHSLRVPVSDPPHVRAWPSRRDPDARGQGGGGRLGLRGRCRKETGPSGDSLGSRLWAADAAPGTEETGDNVTVATALCSSESTDTLSRWPGHPRMAQR